MKPQETEIALRVPRTLHEILDLAARHPLDEHFVALDRRHVRNGSEKWPTNAAVETVSLGMP
eukprot:4609686-Lingulodinium_polyedra.AAC.1